MFFCIFRFLCFILCLSLPASALDNLSLGQAYELALNNNLKLEAEKYKLAVQDAIIQKAKIIPNPKLVSDNGIAEKTYRAGIEQTILLGGKIHQRVSIAKSQKQLTQRELEIIILDLKQNIRKTFTKLYIAQQRQLALSEIYKLTNKLLISSGKMEKAGEAPQLDVLQADIVNKTAQSELQANLFEIKILEEQLSVLINQTLSEKTVLEKPPVLNFHKNTEELIQIAFENRPELASLSLLSEIENQKVKLYKAERIPNLSLTLGPDVVSGSTPNIFAIASLDIPLFNRQQSNILEAKAQEQQYSALLIAKKQEIQLEIQTALNKLEQALEKIKNYENDLLPASQKVTDKSFYAYERGASSLLVALNAQQNLINMKIIYLKSLDEYQNAISDLERAVGAKL